MTGAIPERFVLEASRIFWNRLFWNALLAFETFGMFIVGFSLQHKLEKVPFFQETSLLAHTSKGVVLGMPFLTLSSANLWFAERELVCRTDTAAETL